MGLEMTGDCGFRIGDIANFADRRTVYDRQIVKLELSASCNAHCLFCPMMKNPLKPKGFMKLDDVQSFAMLNETWFKESNFLIEPFFNGESLLNPRFFEIIEVLLASEAHLGDLDSNLGLPIDVEHLAELPWRAVTVNIGGVSQSVHEKVMATSYETVMNNLTLLASSPSRSFPLYVKMNPVSDNIAEQKLLSAFVQHLGHGVQWKAQQTGVPVPTDLSREELNDLCSVIYNPDVPELFRFTHEEDGRIKPTNPRCLYRTPCVNANGIVTVCSHDQLRHLNCGDAFKTPMADILESATYRSYDLAGAERKLNFCEGCN